MKIRQLVIKMSNFLNFGKISPFDLSRLVMVSTEQITLVGGVRKLAGPLFTLSSRHPSAAAQKPAEREGRDPLHSVMKVGGG